MCVMANTIIRHDVATAVCKDVVRTSSIRRNTSNLTAGRVTQLLLLMLLVSTADTHPNDHVPRDKKKLNRNRLNIPEIDTTEIDIDLLNNVAARRNKTAESILKFDYNEYRNQWLTKIKEPPNWAKGIIYWMHRDQRVEDNWALLFAQKLAIREKLPLHVVYCTPYKNSNITLRQYNFMIEGLKKVERELRELNFEFYFLYGDAVDLISHFVRNYYIGAIIVDFLPLRSFMTQVRKLADIFNFSVPVIMVDAHNVVPRWELSEAYPILTIRYVLEGRLSDLLTEFPPMIKHPYRSERLKFESTIWENTFKNFKIDRSVLPVPQFKAGYREGIFELENFLKYRLKDYRGLMINPLKNGLSNLSPWLHFGQISPQRVMLETIRFSNKYSVDSTSFLAEFFLRRERSDVFCCRNINYYDQVIGARPWARNTLSQHSNDTREYLYTRDQFEQAQTHDDLWNAAQLQMMVQGKMHRFLRMYWAKKVLEWTETPQYALDTVIYLNNKYSLDGNDPNSFSGCMWAICGSFDKPQIIERPVIGTVRCMDRDYYKSKFNIEAYIEMHKHYDFNKVLPS